MWFLFCSPAPIFLSPIFLSDLRSLAFLAVNHLFLCIFACHDVLSRRHVAPACCAVVPKGVGESFSIGESPEGRRRKALRSRACHDVGFAKSGVSCGYWKSSRPLRSSVKNFCVFFVFCGYIAFSLPGSVVSSPTFAEIRAKTKFSTNFVS